MKDKMKAKPFNTDKTENSNLASRGWHLTFISVAVNIVSVIFLVLFVAEVYFVKIYFYFVVAGEKYSAGHLFFIATLILVFFAFATSIVGMTAASCRTNKPLYLVFGLSCALSLSFGIMVSVWLSELKILYDLDNKMLATLQKSYQGEFSEDLVSEAWNFVQEKEKTCGVRSVTDWKSSNWASSVTEGPTREWPISCCSFNTSWFNSPNSWSDISDSMVQSCYPIKETGKDTGITGNETSINGTATYQNVNDAINKILSHYSIQAGGQAGKKSDSLSAAFSSQFHFEDIFFWKDTWDQIRGVYFVPRMGTRLDWSNAQEYCKEKAKIDLEDFFQGSAELPIGFNTEEIDMLLGIDQFRSSWRPHMGFMRIQKKSDDMVTRIFDKYATMMTLTTDMNLDSWKPGEPKNILGRDFVCLDFETKQRFACTDKMRYFFCASYSESDETEDAIEDGESRDMFVFKSSKGYSAKIHVTHAFLHFDDARNYCEWKFGEEYDLAVGFSQEELNALADRASLSYIPQDQDPFLGIHRGRPKGSMFYSVQKDVPFASSWAPREPDNKNGDDDEVYGCLHSLYGARGDCRKSVEPFVCAFYFKTPQGWTYFFKGNTYESGPQKMMLDSAPPALNSEGSLVAVRSTLMTFIVSVILALVALLAAALGMLFYAFKNLQAILNSV